MSIRTKIVCTIGPAVACLETMKELIQAGMNVARLNFGHGTHEEHAVNIGLLQQVRAELGVPLAIMSDIKGPEIRVGKLTSGTMEIKPGLRLKIPDEVPIHPLEVLDWITPGMKILFDDGYLISRVIEKSAHAIVIEMQNPGVLKSGKGMNIPEANIRLPAMTQKDIADLTFSCEHGVEMVAASFIRSAHHVLSIRNFLAQAGKKETLLISKIENPQGIQNFDSIVQVSDGIMIARGDLGVELDLALVPKLQKMMIRKSFQACKQTITATQMLESMILYPRPTRAEVSDVANAIYDGSSSIMLSGETAIGKYPIEATRYMQSIAREAESDFDYRAFFEHHSGRDYHDISSAVALAAVKTAYSANAKAIFAYTSSGMTARLLSRLMPEMPIVALTVHKSTYHQLASYWGVIPLYAEGCQSTQEAFAITTHFALARKMIDFGDVVVVTSGAPFGKRGSTNMMRVESIGDVLVRGHKGFGKKVSLPVEIVLSLETYNQGQLEGKIVVMTHCDPTCFSLLKGVGGIVLQNSIGDTASEKYAVFVAKTYDVPVMTRADGAMTVLYSGQKVTLDPQKGLIYALKEAILP